jgi:hypothetical protein
MEIIIASAIKFYSVNYNISISLKLFKPWWKLIEPSRHSIIWNILF